MEYLHTMVRVGNLDASLRFYCELLGLAEVSRQINERGRYTLVFLAAAGDAERARESKAPLLELTHNWDEKEYGGGRNFGHLAYCVDNIYAAVPASARCRRDDQPATAQRPYGIRALTR